MKKNNKEKTETIRPELRLGYVAALFYKANGKKLPKHLDLIHTWFPGFIVAVRDSDPNEKMTPEYIDSERMIHASYYHHYLYSGGEPRIAHIIGKLIGTSSSNLEKERFAANMIQKNVARKLVRDPDALYDEVAHVSSLLEEWDEDKCTAFNQMLAEFCTECAERWYSMDETERDSELFAMDEEVFDQIIYNAFYQLMLYSYEGLCNAYLWLMLGSLLRNEAGRITRQFDSSFFPLYKQPSEEDTLLSRLEYLASSEEFEPYYSGEDTGERFPDIRWYCDKCEDCLSEQDGFDDHLDYWQCRKCGHINPISSSDIFDNREDWHNGIRRTEASKIEEALAETSDHKKKHCK